MFAAMGIGGRPCRRGPGWMRTWGCIGLLAGLSTCASAEQSGGMELVILLDVSEDMSLPATFIGEGAHLATLELGANDKVAVMSFASSVKPISGFTADTRRIEEAFKKATQTMIRPRATRRLYDAVFAAVEQFQIPSSASTKRIIAIITNGVDRGSIHTPDEVVQAATERRIAIWAVLIASPYPADLSEMRSGRPGIPYPDVKFAARELHPMTAKTHGRVTIRDLNGYVLRQTIAICKGEDE